MHLIYRFCVTHKAVSVSKPADFLMAGN